MTTLPARRVALVHDYLTQVGGAERVAGILARALPGARLLTTVHRRGEVPLDVVGGRPWETSSLQRFERLPLKAMLPLLPRAASALDVAGSDVVLASSSAFAHHVLPGPEAHLVCYCSTPAHFLWNPHEYFRGRPSLRLALQPLLRRLRRLDREAAARVDTYVAVSNHIAHRIQAIYGRDAMIVPPPVEVSRFRPSGERSGRFLVVSRLVRSKRVDLVVETANRYGLPLDVIGKGPELRRLRTSAGPTVRVHGWLPDADVRRAMAESTAVIVAGEEDFGLVTAEAQASGRPPVAYAAGGALEIVEDGTTGFLFGAQTVESLGEAMHRAASHDLSSVDLVASATRFDVPVFLDRIFALLDGAAVERERVPPFLRATPAGGRA